jgi:hypothetical protein
MSEKYVIRWRSNVNGRSGIGTRLFSREDAAKLLVELNRDFPQISHEVLPASAARKLRAQTMVEAEESGEPAPAFSE